MSITPINIGIINGDWRDMYGTSFPEFIDKLERDRLGGFINNFFVFSWSKVSYTKEEKRFKTVHKKTHLNVFKPLLDIATIPRFFFYVWKNKIRNDVWICYDFGYVPALWLVKKVFGGRLVMCLNNQPRIYSGVRKFGEVKYFYSWLLEKLFSGLVDIYFTINETMRDYILKLGVVESKIRVFAMNTIERDKDFIEKSKKGAIRKKYNISPDNKIILTVGRLEAEKNYPKFLQLFSSLGDDYTLFILGRGSLLEDLQKKVKELGIEDRVFFEGFVNRDEIWNYYADADAFILISKAEALGVVFWEAMFAEVPIFGSDVEGILETIGNDGERGRIWRDSMTKEEFKNIVSELTKRDNETEAMIVRAKKYVEEKISNKLIINDIV